MVLSLTLDWLAMTFKEATREQVEFVAQYADTAPINPTAPRNGYDTAVADKNGVVRMWHSTREEMGHHVIFAGSALRNIFQQSAFTQRDMVEAAVNSGGRITRLDIAKDAQNVDIDLHSIWDAIRRKENEGTARTFSTIEDDKGSRTIYIGSRQSERFARIYDKRGQLGYEGAAWYRYELECKGMVARAIAALLVDENAWAGAFDGMSLAMFDLPSHKDFQEFYAPGVVLVGIPKIEKQTDREAWIQSQVIKAVVEHYIEFPESEAVKLLIQLLEFNKPKQ